MGDPFATPTFDRVVTLVSGLLKDTTLAVTLPFSVAFWREKSKISSAMAPESVISLVT